MKNYEFIQNQRKNNNLMHESYEFRKENRPHRANGWRCADRKCSAIGSINDNEQFELLVSHANHQKRNILIKKGLFELKLKAENFEGSNMSIISKITSKLQQDDIAAMPKLKSLNDKCTRIKQKNFKPMFDDIPDFLRHDLTGKNFLQFDSGVGSDSRFLIFFSDENRNAIEKIDTVQIDGTFWSVPDGYTQLITINCLTFGIYVQYCFVLINGKSEKCYNDVFKKINEMLNLTFKSIIVDYEIALINALSINFPCAKIYGCRFHYGQSLWRQIQKKGLTKLFYDSFEIKKILKMYMNLIFFPAEDYTKAHDFIREKVALINNENLYEFDEYFLTTYAGCLLRQPLFENDFSSVYSRVLNGISRTTNNLEAFHRSLNAKCHVHHLNFGKFVEILQEETEKIRILVAQTKHDIDVYGKDLVKEEKLRVIANSYQQYTTSEYFEILNNTVSWVLNMN